MRLRAAAMSCLFACTEAHLYQPLWNLRSQGSNRDQVYVILERSVSSRRTSHVNVSTKTYGRSKAVHVPVSDGNNAHLPTCNRIMSLHRDFDLLTYCRLAGSWSQFSCALSTSPPATAAMHTLHKRIGIQRPGALPLYRVCRLDVSPDTERDTGKASKRRYDINNMVAFFISSDTERDTDKMKNGHEINEYMYLSLIHI